RNIESAADGRAHGDQSSRFIFIFICLGHSPLTLDHRPLASPFTLFSRPIASPALIAILGRSIATIIQVPAADPASTCEAVDENPGLFPLLEMVLHPHMCAGRDPVVFLGFAGLIGSRPAPNRFHPWR